MSRWMRDTVVNRGSCLPSTAKLYRTRLGPWRTWRAGSRSSWPDSPPCVRMAGEVAVRMVVVMLRLPVHGGAVAETYAGCGIRGACYARHRGTLRFLCQPYRI